MAAMGVVYDNQAILAALSWPSSPTPLIPSRRRPPGRAAARIAQRGVHRTRPASQDPARLRRPGTRARATGNLHRAPPASAAKRWTTSCCSARRAWARPRWRISSRTKWACSCGQTSGPVLERPGDLAALLTNLEKERRPVHRRNPSPVARGRRNPVPGAGRLPDRHPDRRRPGRAQRSSWTCSPSPWSAPPPAPAC